MRQPSIFLSHNYRDKPFVRTLAQDLSAMGVKVWLDAELKVGDSLISKVSAAIDEMQYLGVVLSPNSVDSGWVKEELNQVLIRQLSDRHTSVLPIMLADCQVPGFLRDRLYADFRDPGDYDTALRKLLTSIGVDLSKAQGAMIRDPFANRLNRVSMLYARPKTWHCIVCGCGVINRTTTIYAWSAEACVRSRATPRRSSCAGNAGKAASAWHVSANGVGRTFNAAPDRT